MIRIVFFCIWSSWVSSHRSAGWAVTMLIRAVGVWFHHPNTHSVCCSTTDGDRLTLLHWLTHQRVLVHVAVCVCVCLSGTETCRKFCKVKKTQLYEYSPKSQSHCLKLCVLLGRMPTTLVFVCQSESCNTTLSQSLSYSTESHPQCQGVIVNLYHCALSTLVSHLWDRLLLLARSLFPAWPLLRQTEFNFTSDCAQPSASRRASLVFSHKKDHNTVQRSMYSTAATSRELCACDCVSDLSEYYIY